MSTMTAFYTYIYYDPSRNGEPIYVGKGHNRRAWYHLKRRGKHPLIQRLNYMKNHNIAPSIFIIDALDESHAFLMEECLIEIIGRKDLGKGSLLNLTDGGDGVSNPSDATRIRIGAANKGIKRTPEQIRVNSEYRKGRPTGRKGIPNPMKKTTPHGNVGKIRTEEFKENLSKLHVGKSAWNKGISSEKTACIHCGKLMDAGNMKLHHGDNCKNKRNKENGSSL